MQLNEIFKIEKIIRKDEDGSTKTIARVDGVEGAYGAISFYNG